MAEIVTKNIGLLKAHSKNEMIYGIDEDVSELKNEIRESGKVVRLVITPNDTIISGHRRVKACKELVQEGDKRFETVECEVVDYDTEDDEVADIILYNKSRVKTLEQKVREAREMLELEKIAAAKRKEGTLKQNQNTVPPTLAERAKENKTGESRNIVAAQLGLKSGQELDRVIKAIDMIDELLSQGREEDAALIRNVLNNGTASAAEKLAKHIDILSAEDKFDIQQGNVSVNKAVNARLNEDKVKSDEDKTVVIDGVEYNSFAEDEGNDWNSFSLIPGTVGNSENRSDENENENPCDIGNFASRINDDVIMIDENGKIRADDDKIIRVFDPGKISARIPLNKDEINSNIMLMAEPESFEEIYSILSKINDWLMYLVTCKRDNISNLMNSAVNDETLDSDTRCDYANVFNEFCLTCGRLKWITNPILKRFNEESIRKINEAEEKRNADKNKKSKKTVEEREKATHGQMVRCVKSAAEMYARDEKNKAARKEAGVMVD